MKLQGVLFDLDGTLIDSEPNWFVSDATFVEHFGGIYDEAWREECVGMGSKNFVVMVKDRFHLKASVEELLALKDRLYLETAKGNTRAYPEMLKLVKGFAAQGMPMAVASGSSLAIIEAVLDEVGIRNLFRGVFSSDEVARSKPFPDVFLLAAAQLGLSPQDVLVLEDSQFGVEAAKAAGMRVCAVPTVWPPGGDASLRKADLLFEKGHDQFRAETVFDWIDRTFCQCEDCTLYDLGRCQD
jgi:HAD superfamily hydrolase (TIGR01509 family)